MTFNPRHVASLIAAACVLACLTGCPGEPVKPIARVCKTAGTQCMLGASKLGVCTAIPGKVNALTCQSQH